MKEVLISIIIPIYNSEIFLDRCIESIINQKYDRFELILINDGSNDRSLDICKKWSKKDNRIRIIDKDNTGVSASRNIGIKSSNGDYVMFVDADDYIDGNLLQRFVTVNKNCKYDLFVFNYYILKNDEMYSGILNTPTDNYLTELYNNTLKGYVWNKIYKKELIVNNLFNTDIKVCEDLLFNYEIANNKDIVYYYDNKELYFYYQNDSSVVHNKFDADLTKFLAYNKIIEILPRKDYAEQKKVEFIINLEMLKLKQFQFDNNIIEIENIQKIYIKDILFKKSKIRNKLKIIFVIIFPNIYKKVKEGI